MISFFFRDIVASAILTRFKIVVTNFWLQCYITVFWNMYIFLIFHMKQNLEDYIAIISFLYLRCMAKAFYDISMKYVFFSLV